MDKVHDIRVSGFMLGDDWDRSVSVSKFDTPTITFTSESEVKKEVKQIAKEVKTEHPESTFIKELASVGHTYHQICDITGLSLYKVFKIAREHGTRKRQTIIERQRKAIVKTGEKDVSLRSIAQKLGCGKDTVRRQLMKAGIVKKPHRITDKQREKILSLLETNRSLNSIAIEVGCSHWAVTKIRGNHGT